MEQSPAAQPRNEAFPGLKELGPAIEAFRFQREKAYNAAILAEVPSVVDERIAAFLARLKTRYGKRVDLQTNIPFQVLANPKALDTASRSWSFDDFDGADSVTQFIDRGFREKSTEPSSEPLLGTKEPNRSIESREVLRVTNRELGCHRDVSCQAHLVFPSAKARAQFVSTERLCPKCKRKLDSQDLGFPDYGKGNLEVRRKMSDPQRDQKFFYTRRGGVGYMVAKPGFFNPFDEDGYEYNEETGLWDERKMHVTYAE